MCDNCHLCLAADYNRPRTGVKKATTEDFQRLSRGFQVSQMDILGAGSPFDWLRPDALRVLRLFTMILLRTLAGCSEYARRGIPAFCKPEDDANALVLRRKLDELIAGDLNSLQALLSCDRDDVFRFLHLAMNEFVGEGMGFAGDLGSLVSYDGKSSWERNFNALFDGKREEILRAVADAKLKAQNAVDGPHFICPEWMTEHNTTNTIASLLGRHAAAFNGGNFRASEACLKEIETLDHMRDAEGALLFYALVNSRLLGKITFEESHSLVISKFIRDTQLELNEVNLHHLLEMFKRTWKVFFVKVENLVECQRGDVIRRNLAEVDEDQWCISMLFAREQSEQKAVRAVMDAVIEFHNKFLDKILRDATSRAFTFGDIISARSDFLVSCSLSDLEGFCNHHSLFSAPLEHMFLLEDFVACRMAHERVMIQPVFEDFVYDGQVDLSAQLRVHYDGKQYWKPADSKIISRKEKSSITEHLRTRGVVVESVDMIVQVLQFTMRLSRMFIEESKLPDFSIIEYVKSNFRAPFEHLIPVLESLHPDLKEKFVLGNAHEMLIQMSVETRIGDEFNVAIPVDIVDLVRRGLQEVTTQGLESLAENLEESSATLSNFQHEDSMVIIFDTFMLELPAWARRVMMDRNIMVKNFVPFLHLVRDIITRK
jgi:hypothetical protein